MEFLLEWRSEEGWAHFIKLLNGYSWFFAQTTFDDFFKGFPKNLQKFQIFHLKKLVEQ